jgi:phosphoribosylglycinamide formyltransferase-1
MNCAVFASGGGSNFQALLDRKQAGDLHLDFALLIGNNSAAHAFERARAHNIPTLHLTSRQFASEQEYSQALLDALQQHQVECIALCGYMKKIPSLIVRHYHNRILNIHPALLPAFGGQGMYGIRVHQAVLDYGAKLSGITVHLVDDEYDHGPVILQASIAVQDSDTAETLAARVLEVEHAHYWRALEAFAQGRIRIENRRVVGNV